MSDIKNHKRVNDILLGPLERPALKWLSEHMPAWVTPDGMTTFGVFGSLMIFAGYGLTYFDPGFIWLASLGFVINWFGDSLDGTLARYRNIQRPIYGFYIDHVSDTVSMILVFFGLGLSPYVKFDYASLGLTAYLLLSIHVYLKTAVDSEFKISFAHIGPTEARALAIICNTVVFFAGNPIIKIGSINVAVYDWVVILFAIAMAGAFAVSAYGEARRLSALDIQKLEARKQNKEARKQNKEERRLRKAATRRSRAAVKRAAPSYKR